MDYEGYVINMKPKRNLVKLRKVIVEKALNGSKVTHIIFISKSKVNII